MKPCIYVCVTCRYSAGQAEDDTGRSGGTLLMAALRTTAAARLGDRQYEIRDTRCLMACTEHCNVHLRAPGKICYIAGRFAPTTESAEAIVSYFGQYLDSATGQVPYRSWPQGMKGHFIARVPPFPD